LLAYGLWFSPGTPASSTTKTGRHDIAEIFAESGAKHQKSTNQHTEKYKRLIIRPKKHRHPKNRKNYDRKRKLFYHNKSLVKFDIGICLNPNVNMTCW